jgi:S1-C subfamily serine protease
MNVRKVRQALTVVLCSWICQTLNGENADQLTASGTGFFVSSSGYFLTNYHVIRGATKVKIKVNEVVLDSRVVTVDAVNDVAVLKADDKFADYNAIVGATSFQWLALKGSGTVSLGDDVFTIGFPNPELQGVAPKLTKGTVSATSGVADDPRLFQVSIPVQPGNSGGPLVDESGHAVGIVNASLSAAMMLRTSGALPQNVNYAIKSAYILPLLQGIASKDDSVPQPSNSTKHEIIAHVEKAVGLVLVYSDPSSVERAEKSGKPTGVSPTEPASPVTGKAPHYDGDFDKFVSRLRTAVHEHNLNAIAAMMSPGFAYVLGASPAEDRQGPGVFQYWDKKGLWVELDRIISGQFVQKGRYMVAPLQFASKTRYRGYRAGMVKIEGKWRFVYFVKD